MCLEPFIYLNFVQSSGRMLPPERDGQFHELAEELRSLHEQVGAFGQRLSSLNEIVARIIQMRSEHPTAEDRTQSMPSFPVEYP
jgi:hypothetical protein